MSTSGVPRNLKDVVRHFTPAWFTVVMGTGAVSALFNNYPYAHGSSPMKILSVIFFLLNVVLFVLFNLFTICRYTFWPEIWPKMLRHPVQSLFLGTYPMGLATILNVAAALVSVEYRFGGNAFLYFVWACWWFDVVLSFTCAFPLMHIMFTVHKTQLSDATTVWMIPPATLVVASSSGGILASALQPINPSHALVTLVVTTFMLITGLVLDFTVYTIYFQRLLLHGPPAASAVLTTVIALGPTGQGGYAITLVGQNFKTMLPLDYGDSPFMRSETAGETVYVICVCLAFGMWAITTMWLFYALLALQEAVREARIPFGLQYWGAVFPNGVYANLTIALYNILDSKFFQIWGAIYAAITIALWVVLLLKTLPMVYKRTIFSAPELIPIDGSAEVEKEEQRRMEAKQRESGQFVCRIATEREEP
ncbi:uncharacterized protein LAESUDRAFT_671957 [Laetiporus sulphureus 93-53]|uniref:C4-dicarboxylate transporter/malic acid transport protein n=1 Tax=Laetiporus sulphureus 93-53 TaxID=1314785 RepID=A0A165GPA3_9APHY|nr:uncharacterized protein LAESUDRAFT_671957 [Laetiporus sulphureus 93-53]KZT10620.1 hypothetical protein LAESUDRAFT_671957 [Laetiporus sulphureus 93-53]